MSDTLEKPADASIPAEESAAKPNIVLVVLLLLVGIALTYGVARHGGPAGLQTRGQILVLVFTAALIAVPFVRRGFGRAIEAVRYPSARGRMLTAIAIGIVAFAYLFITARQQHRDLFPRIHDECSYTIQTRMLSELRLWEPAHPLADFFESFHFLTQPVYASIYFPGTALMNVPGVWLREPTWFVPLLLAAMVIAMTYRITAELVDGAAGMLAALLVLATCMFRVYSTMVMAQVPVMLLGLLMAWAWLRWCANHKWHWSMLVGAFAGWAAITRPVDAAAFAVPVGIAMLWQLRRETIRGAGLMLAGMLLGALPFLTLQVVFDFGVTGHPFKTPYVMYLEQNQPGSVFGSGTDRISRPKTQLPQKQVYFEQLAGSEKQERNAGLLAWIGLRLRMAASATLPCAAVLALMPVGLLIARERGRWVVLLAIPIFLVAYAFNPFFLLHYAIPLAAGAAICVVLGIRAIEQAMPSDGARRYAGTFLSGALAVLAIGSLPQLNKSVSDEPYRTPLMDRVERAMAEIPAPAVVFFRYSNKCSVHEEPVYNMDATWPDDAPIVRAQELGARDVELLRYYAARQPDRTFYILDRATGVLLPLGYADKAAEAMGVSLQPNKVATADVR